MKSQSNLGKTGWMRLLQACVAFGGIAGIAGSVQAFQPLITDDTGTQGDGGHQLELSLTRDRAKTAEESERTRTMAGTYTYGLNETIDLFAGMSHARIDARSSDHRTSGFGNPVVGVKWRFFEEETTGSSLALKPEIVLPVSASRERDGLGSGKTSGNLTLIFTQEVSFGAVHVNAGLGRERFRDSDASPTTNYRRFSVAPVWDVSEQWKLALDLGLESARADGDTTRTRFVELGAIYAANKNLDFAFGAVRSIDNASPKTTTHSLTAGVTWRF